LAAINSIFLEGKILKGTNLVEVVLDFLDNTWRSVLAKVVHAVKCLKNSLPFLGF
jgi:hypothetical protein